MTLADFVTEIASHQFTAVLHFNLTQPLNMTNAQAITILEGPTMLDRVLTAQELTWLGELQTGLTTPTFTAGDFEAAQLLLETGAISQAEFLTLLGL